MERAALEMAMALGRRLLSAPTTKEHTMYPRIPKLLLSVALASSLGACAAFSDFAPRTPEYERLAQLHAGLTQDEVRNIAGKPDNVTSNSRPGGEAVWIYDYSNEWGARAEFDVTFGADGRVSSTYTEDTF